MVILIHSLTFLKTLSKQRKTTKPTVSSLEVSRFPRDLNLEGLKVENNADSMQALA